MDRRRKNPRIFNILLAILCIVVFAGFAAFLLWNRQDVAQETARLQELAQEQQMEERAERQNQTDAAASENEESADGVSETEGGDESLTDDEAGETASGDSGSGAGETAEADSGSSEGDTAEADDGSGETASEEASEESGSAGAEETAEAQAASMGISCWGDEFYEPEAAEQYSYRAVLQRILDENGYDLTVANKTLEGAGTLSMMKMAGVPQEDLDAYIAQRSVSSSVRSRMPVSVTARFPPEASCWAI